MYAVRMNSVLMRKIMLNEKEILDWTDESRSGLFDWWYQMADRELAFHPDDPPSTIVYVESGEPVFTVAACRKLEGIYDRMMQQHGELIYEAGFQAVWERLGRGQSVG